MESPLFKRYELNKVVQRPSRLSRQCPGCGQWFPMSEVSWLRSGQNCFKESEPDQCPLVQRQRAWLSQMENNPAFNSLRQAEALFGAGDTKAAEAEVDRTLSLLLGE